MHSYKLQTSNFLEVRLRSNDNWTDASPLPNLVTAREIHTAAFTLQSKVANVWANGWLWLMAWNDKNGFDQIIPPTLCMGKKDVLCWKDDEFILLEFSVSRAWNVIRPVQVEVEWHPVVWFSQCIP